ncbi:YciI family protein [Tuwongella immobilis]|uniref:YCII-related domain-containing protein n=1 Tax=Tuwongella immobilis TaxID=692036 RepID=A0A6C2YJY4_9BACT|nr:YciI family protein [Tuwongella immobilis]VIP01539.1 YCII-related protein OS=Cupriavidus pinatubonensis (strain JMP 134 / LMG 1197) GN=Reut_B5221 PE=4 SV=1: YCII [Tuwongella immobilis]VTR98709.1 YCII-related protein OS=Cupriavidus pinatubonensis (strain JMP 134 / LMG 1197) GN=Reut_B5221 PE=4 SV=1: YCII [Tuwongella immobilis]
MKYAAVIEYLQDAEVVNAHRPAHRAYLAGLLAEGKLAASGPFVDGFGALIVYEADSLEAAEALIQNDPFKAAGVFLRWTVREWKVVISSPTAMTVA